jgi:hypothetical protein
VSPKTPTTYYGSGGNGGGVGMLGSGANGAGGINPGGGLGSADPTGRPGGDGSTVGGYGAPGKGGRSGGITQFYCPCCGPQPTPNGQQQPGGVGGVRILYPGATRSYPSTNTGDL